MKNNDLSLQKCEIEYERILNQFLSTPFEQKEEIVVGTNLFNYQGKIFYLIEPLNELSKRLDALPDSSGKFQLKDRVKWLSDTIFILVSNL